MTDRSYFIHPHSHYYGEPKPEYITFHKQMEDFVQEANIISNLAGNDKISLEEAFKEIEKLWLHLVETKQQLGIGKQLAPSDQ